MFRIFETNIIQFTIYKILIRYGLKISGNFCVLKINFNTCRISNLRSINGSNHNNLFNK